MKTKDNISVDVYLEMNKAFWQELQTVCVSACCGFDAFDFSEEKIKDVIINYDKAEIIENLALLLNEIERSNLKYVESDIFNERTKRSIFAERIKRIKKVVCSRLK